MYGEFWGLLHSKRNSNTRVTLVQSALVSAHQESNSTATNKYAGTINLPKILVWEIGHHPNTKCHFIYTSANEFAQSYIVLAG